MLQTAKPKFEKDVEKILKKSMYEAFKSTFLTGDEDVVNKHMENAIKESAKKFSESVAKEATIPLTDAIDEYIEYNNEIKDLSTEYKWIYKEFEIELKDKIDTNSIAFKKINYNT